MHSKRFFFILFPVLLILPVTGKGQINTPRYWITFTDKQNTPYSISHPEAFLTERSIERRLRQNIPVTEEDLPVDPAYPDSLTKLGIRLINVSRWFNGALITSDDTILISDLENLSFIKNPAILLRPAINEDEPVSPISMEKNACIPTLAPYGYSTSQITMLHGEYLHNLGYRGEGKLIAILDAGFSNADHISSLSHVWQENRVIAIRDFVADENTLFMHSSEHGTAIFSIIAGIEEDFLYGSAPNSSFVLARTEEVAHEFLVEEYNWVCGAEFADSLGADIINSSLGYSLFDDPAQDHTYSDMDGRTTPVSIAAGKAASKGMVIVSSAGNSGNSPWFHIIAPADADSILAIGAVDSLGSVTFFSSRGPSYDRRIKPDVCSQGLYTVSQFPDGSFIYCAGTSCSAPLISGMTACLWQANPGASSFMITDAIRKTGDHYFNPDSLYGYGIPDFLKADWILGHGVTDTINSLTSFSLFPNPAHDYFYLVIRRPLRDNSEDAFITVYDITGNLCKQVTKRISGNNYVIMLDSPANLNTGLYYLQVIISEGTYTISFLKN
jgi:serine protease AprX